MATPLTITPGLRRRKRLRQAYGDFLENPLSKDVLMDLRQFCRADAPTFVEDDPSGRLSAYLEGQRRVWLHIVAMARLTRDDLDLISQESTLDE